MDIPDRLLADLEASGLASHLGSEGASVRVVELFDYQCPACAVAHVANWPLLRQLAEQGVVRYSAYDVPLPRHPNAVPAAVTAGCVAQVSPGAFWDYRNVVLAGQGAWAASRQPQALFTQLSSDVGADTAAVRACVEREGNARAAALKSAWRLSEAAGISSSPAWEVNGTPVRWNEVLEEIETGLARAR